MQTITHMPQCREVDIVCIATLFLHFAEVQSVLAAHLVPNI